MLTFNSAEEKAVIFCSCEEDKSSIAIAMVYFYDEADVNQPERINSFILAGKNNS